MHWARPGRPPGSRGCGRRPEEKRPYAKIPGRRHRLIAMPSSFFALFDDIATLLDDVSVMTKVAT